MGGPSDKVETERPKRTRIELLVRGEEGDGFRTREVPSAWAYLESRPQRIPDPECELARLPSGLHGSATYVLKNRRTEDYLLLTEQEQFLWQLMDGRVSLQEIGTGYVMRYGSFDFEIIPQLISKLRQAQLLTMRPASRLREVLARNQNPAARAAEAVLHALERLTVTSRTSHDVFDRIYRYGAFLLFTPFAVAVLAVLVALGGRSAVLLWGESGDVTAGLARHPVVAILLVKLFFWLTVVSHQIMHALACVHYRRRVREFGFTMLHGFIPTFYVDVTDIFMASRRARIVNALAGPLVHLFLGALYFWGASFPGPGLLKGFLAASAILQLQSFLVSLYPFAFLEMDGYHILVDVLGAPTLKHDSVRFVRESLLSKLKSRARWTWQEVAWLAYFVLSLVSIAAFVLLNVWLLVHASKS
ncbi:MAG TPA: M50 family metallopeptidase [Methylomirabilota bacterium]|jgi:putative peptide zinc metalloprotease protein|nr:M50 family metallopeptidase [Methylomirabilota bacterium]